MYDELRREYVTPSGPDIHHDALLSNLAIAAFDMGDDQFVANQVFPAVPVGNQSDNYAIIQREQFQRNENTRRAPKTRARRVEFGVSSDQYFAHNHALAGELALEDIANADNAFQLRDNTQKVVIQDMLLAQEVRIADLCTTSGNLTTGVASLWGSTTGDILGDVSSARASIRSNTGLRANLCVMDEDTFEAVRVDTQILDMYKHTTRGPLTEELIAQAFRVGRILVAPSIRENALEGGTSSVTNIWGNAAVFMHVGPNTGLQSRTLGLRFQWRPPMFPAPLATTRNVERGAGSRWVEIVEVHLFQDEKFVATELGHLTLNTSA